MSNQQAANTDGGDPQVGAWLAAERAEVEARLAEVEAAIAALLAEIPEAAVVQTVCGVGPLVAAAVLGYLPPELWGEVKQAAAFAGVHPRRTQSGQRDRSQLSKHGHARLRRYLYVAATVALQRSPEMAAFAARLQTNEHTRQSAHCAVMHKILRQPMGALRRYYRTQEEALAMTHAA